MVTFEDFKKLNIKIGRIVVAEKIEGSDKLMRLEVDLGDERRQVVAGISQFYNPETLLGKEVPIVENLEPRSFKGIESKGMILAADVGGRPILLHPEADIPPGSVVR
jgi:methionine--tRNA ligase beta chain